MDSSLLRRLFSPIALILCLMMGGCDDNEFELSNQNHQQYADSLTLQTLNTRAEERGFWEYWEVVELADGQKVNTPWNMIESQSAVPIDILHDVAYADGWDLIHPKFTDKENGNRLDQSPYLIFHNRYTGILKGFCYLSGLLHSPNNYGVWEIFTQNATSLFAFQNNPVSKINQKEVKKYYVNNITTSDTRGFSIGWNCFQIELAYDPDQSGMMTINAYSRNISKINLSGNLSSETSGLITQTNKKDATSGLAGIAGNEAGKWVRKKVEDKGITLANIASAVTKALVSKGVGAVLSAFTGLWKKDETISKSVQLRTDAEFSMIGENEFNATNGIVPLNFSIEKSHVGRLGVWGLIEEPTLLFSPYAMLKEPQNYSNGYTVEYTAKIKNPNVKASVCINPDLARYITSSKVITDYYQAPHYTRTNVWGYGGPYGRTPQTNKKVYDNLYKTNTYMDVDVAFTGYENTYLPVGTFDPPMEVFLPNVPGGPKGATPTVNYNSSFMAVVGVNLIMPDGSESYSYHQCIPWVDWDFDEYNNGLYEWLYPCVPVEPSYGMVWRECKGSKLSIPIKDK